MFFAFAGIVWLALAVLDLLIVTGKHAGLSPVLSG